MTRWHEDYWTPSEAEDGWAPQNAVWVPEHGVYRVPLEDEDEDVWLYERDERAVLEDEARHYAAEVEDEARCYLEEDGGAG